VKLPRDLSGKDLAKLLRRYGYEFVRQVGSHMRHSSSFKGHEHHITIPDYSAIRVGTLAEIMGDVADYLEIERAQLIEELFGR
jgi:predicted RNA binding protein YcfA (HicA-like mRNA interferase family)